VIKKKRAIANVTALRSTTLHDDVVVRDPTLEKIKALYAAGKRPTVNPAFNGSFNGRVVYDPSFIEFHENSKTDMVNFRPLIDPYFPSPDVSGNVFYEYFTCNPTKMDVIPMPVATHRELLEILDERIGCVSPAAWQNPEDSDDIQFLFSKILTFLFGGLEFWDGIERRSCLMTRLALPMRFGHIAVQLEPEEPAEKIAHIYMTPFDIHPRLRPEYFTTFLKWITTYVEKPKDYFYFAAVKARNNDFSSSIQYTEAIEKTLRGLVLQRASGGLPERDEKYKLHAQLKVFLDFRTDHYYTGELDMNESVAPMFIPYRENITEMARYTWWVEYFRRVDCGEAPDQWLFSSTEQLAKYHELVLENYRKVAVIYQHRPFCWLTYTRHGKLDVDRAKADRTLEGFPPMRELPPYTQQFFDFNEHTKDLDAASLGWERCSFINPYDPLNTHGPRLPPDFNAFYFGLLPQLVRAEFQQYPERFSNPRAAMLHCLCRIELGTSQYLTPSFMVESHMVSLINQLIDAVFVVIQQRLGGRLESFKPAVKEFTDTFNIPFKLSKEVQTVIYKDVYLGHYTAASNKAREGKRSLTGAPTCDNPLSTAQHLDWNSLA